MWLCCNSVGQTGSRDLSKFPNTTAKTQRTFLLLQKTWLCRCKHNSGGAQDLPAPACFPAIQKNTALAALDKGDNPIGGLCHIQNMHTCSAVHSLSIRHWECLLLSALCHCLINSSAAFTCQLYPQSSQWSPAFSFLLHLFTVYR